jgi:ATP-binding cassette subfamily F protein 3
VPIEAWLEIGGERLHGLPAFDGGSTGPDGIEAELRPIADVSGIGVCNVTPNLNTPSISSAEQRKIDAQKRQLLAAQTRPLKRELEQNEQRMASIEAEKTQLEQQLSSPLPPAEIAEAGRRLKALSDEVSSLEERWLELTHLLEETA